MALGLRERLHAPAFSVEGLDGAVVLGDVPVRADDPFETLLLAQQAVDDEVVVAVADIAAPGVLAVGDGVVGHHGRGGLGAALDAEGPFDEGPHVRLELAAGIDGVFAIAVVGVAASFLRTAGGPVLDHGVDAAHAPAVLAVLGGLEAFHIGPGHGDVELRILAEGAAEAAPARLRGQVDLRAEGRGDAEGPVLGRGDHAEPAHHPRVEGGGEAQRGGPERDLAAGAGVELGRGARLVARVRGIVGRDAVAEGLHEGLDAVVPARGDLGRGDARHEHGAQVVLFEELALGGRDRVGRHALVAAVEHQAGDLLDAELRGQVLRPLQGGLAPVFVDVERAVAVEVLEDFPADMEERGGADAERRAAALGDLAVVVDLDFLHFRHAGGEQEQGEEGEDASHVWRFALS